MKAIISDHPGYASNTLMLALVSLSVLKKMTMMLSQHQNTWLCAKSGGDDGKWPTTNTSIIHSPQRALGVAAIILVIP